MQDTSALGRSGYTSVFNEHRVCVFPTEGSPDQDPIPLLSGRMIDNLYLIDFNKQKHVQIANPARIAAFIAATRDPPTPEHVARLLTLTLGHLLQHEVVVSYDTASSNSPFSVNVTATEAAATKPTPVDANLWHRRLGHPARTTLEKVCQSVENLPAFSELSSAYNLPCEHCLDRKSVV